MKYCYLTKVEFIGFYYLQRDFFILILMKRYFHGLLLVMNQLGIISDAPAFPLASVSI